MINNGILHFLFWQETRDKQTADDYKRLLHQLSKLPVNEYKFDYITQLKDKREGKTLIGLLVCIITLNNISCLSWLPSLTEEESLDSCNEWVIYCCLTPNEQFSSYIKVRTSYI
jgi:hypothetical protein